MTTKQAYIETFGCQMNERDSEIMAQLLASQEYAPTRDIEAADLIIVNTCSIREKAEQKAYSLLGRLRAMKQRNPGLIIAVSGCVAQQEGLALRQRLPFVDLIIGPQNIYRLPELLAGRDRSENLNRRRPPRIATDLSPAFAIPPFLPIVTPGSVKRFVTIMQGCNNFCTYCVVPHTRGREISRKSRDILTEIKHLADKGIKEVTLLGQNVNSYGLDTTDNDAIRNFPELLQAVNAIAGLERIRFTTSHPKDLSDDLIGCFAKLDKLCGHMHLPVQSGANRILGRMNRKYSIETYLEKVKKLREVLPEIVLTTDIIVGFPGETDTDFEATMTLIETVRFDGGFSFKYSDRPQAPAAAFRDKVPEDLKDSRLNRLQARQNEITLERHQTMIGKEFSIMVEGLSSKNAAGQWRGRTNGNIIVNFAAEKQLCPGQTVRVKILAACRNSLKGETLP